MFNNRKTLKTNLLVPTKIADLLKKIGLVGTQNSETYTKYHLKKSIFCSIQN